MAGHGQAGLTSIIVVAADSGPLLAQAVASALAQSAPVEVLLVDNASTDGAVEQVLATHPREPRLRLLRNPRNLGFGPACNRGAAAAHGDALLFLNPDCRLATDTVAALRDVLAGDAGIGLLGLTVCDAAGRPARGNRRREPTLRRALMSMTGLAHLEARWPALAGVEMPPAAPGGGTETVEAVSGACMLLPRAAFDAVGGFDEAYFLHAEDLDLCRRLRDAGWRVAIAGNLRAIHEQGSSSRHRPLFVSRHKHRGLWRYFTKFDPAARNPLLRGAVWLGLWTHFLLTAPLHLVRARLRRSRARPPTP